MKKHLQKDAGFTVIELVIAMQLTLLIIGMAYSSFLFTQTLYMRWQSKTDTEQQLNLIHQQYSLRLNQLTHIRTAESHLLVGQSKRREKIQLQIAIPLHSAARQKEIPDGFYGTFFYLVDGKKTWDGSLNYNSIGRNETLPISAVRLEGNYWHSGKSYPVKIVQRLVRRRPIVR